MNEQKQQTVQELIEQADIESDRAQTNAITTSTNCRKALAMQLVKFAELSNTQAIEIQRLQELLRENHIQFTLPIKPTLETPPTTEL